METSASLTQSRYQISPFPWEGREGQAGRFLFFGSIDRGPCSPKRWEAPVARVGGGRVRAELFSNGEPVRWG